MVLIKTEAAIEIMPTEDAWKIRKKRTYFRDSPHVVRLLSRLRRKGFVYLNAKI